MSQAPVATATPEAAIVGAPQTAPILERRLASGGSLHLRAGENGEELELRSARGDLDLHIVLTAAGPVVSLRCARLEVDSPEVAFRCDTFDVKTKGDLRLASEREITLEADELRARTERDIHLNGAYVRLNCTPDLEVPVPMPDVAAFLQATGQAHACGHDHGAGQPCGHDHATAEAALPTPSGSASEP
jgi:hypothetical protein